MKHALPISVLFMALALGGFLVHPNSQGAWAFGLACTLFGFLSYLERARHDELDAIRKDILQLKTEISSVAVRLGW